MARLQLRGSHRNRWARTERQEARQAVQPEAKPRSSPPRTTSYLEIVAARAPGVREVGESSGAPSAKRLRVEAEVEVPQVAEVDPTAVEVDPETASPASGVLRLEVNVSRMGPEARRQLEALLVHLPRVLVSSTSPLELSRTVNDTLAFWAARHSLLGALAALKLGEEAASLLVSATTSSCRWSRCRRLLQSHKQNMTSS